MSSIKVATMVLVYWSVLHPVGGKGMGYRVVDVGIVILARSEYNFFLEKL